MTLLELYRESGVRTLPADPRPMARCLGVSLVTYEKYCRDTGGDMLSLLRDHNPDAFTQKLNGRTAVVYNRQLPPGRRRWNVVHELSHILLGDLDAKAAGDTAADRLTADILCPLPVVSLCGVRTVRELQTLCGLSHTAAEIRWDALCTFRRGELGSMTDADWALVRHFEGFISAVLDGASPQSTTFPLR